MHIYSIQERRQPPLIWRAAPSPRALHCRSSRPPPPPPPPPVDGYGQPGMSSETLRRSRRPRILPHWRRRHSRMDCESAVASNVSLNTSISINLLSISICICSGPPAPATAARARAGPYPGPQISTMPYLFKVGTSGEFIILRCPMWKRRANIRRNTLAKRQTKPQANIRRNT